LTPLNKWASASCPARVDVAGGWSDTPPITYEHGGAVVNVAITVDGKVFFTCVRLFACQLLDVMPIEKSA